MGRMTTGPEATDACRPLRADAARNRELILETAAEVFAEQGLEAGYDEIARRAGVGVGTVYRRFPERDELVQALFESRVNEIVAIAEHAAAMDDPWEGLTAFMTGVLERQYANRGLKEVMARIISKDDHVRVGQDQLGPMVDAMVNGAQAAGAVRADVGSADVGAVLMLLGSMTTPAEPELWRRYLALFLDGLRRRPELRPLPMHAPDDECVHAIMCQLRGR